MSCAQAHLAELAWLLTTECPAVLKRVRASLEECALSMREVTAAERRPLTGGTEEAGLKFRAAVGATALLALNFTFDPSTAWPEQRATPNALDARLVDGQRKRLVMPALQAVQAGLAHALTASRCDADTLAAALHVATTLEETLAAVCDALSQRAAPSSPSELARALSASLDPVPPPDLLLDATVCGAPPALCISAYLRRPGGGKGGGSGGKPDWTAVAAHHASAPLAGIGERLPALRLALQLCHELCDKLLTHASMPHANPESSAPPLDTRAAAVAAALVEASGT